MQFSLKAALRGGVAFSVGLTMAGFASTAARAETNWTGFYTGFAAGIANVHNSTDIQELCDYDGYDCAKRTTDSTGVSGSLYGGYMQPLPMGNIVVGVEGVIFKPMGYTMGFALLASIVLALSFVPSGASFLFQSSGHPHEPRLVEWLKRIYTPLLGACMKHPGTVFAVMVGLLCLSLAGAARLGTEFLPELNEGSIWVNVFLPPSVSVDEARSKAANKDNFK